jgi:hypothetical protein
MSGSEGRTSLWVLEGENLAVHVATVIADAEEVGLEALEAAGCDMPRFSTNLAHRAGAASRASG